MKFSTFLFAWFTVVVPLTATSQGRLPDAPQGKVVACDLIDELTVTSLFSSPIRQKSPNRQIQLINGARFSVCLFFTKRNVLRTDLYEYPTEELAKKGFTAYRAGSDAEFQFQPERGLGDEAAWFRLRAEKYGFIVRKGKNVYVLDTSWWDADSGNGLKERMKPIASAALAKL